MSVAYGYQLFARLPATKPQIFVAGLPMDTICPWANLRTNTRLTGTWQISWTMLRHPRKPLKRHSALHVGAPVELRLGPHVTEVGSLTEPDWDSGDLIAIGAPREAENVMALTGPPDEFLTTKPNTAIDEGIARLALNWTRGSDFGNTPIGQADDAGNLTSVARVLDARAEDADNPELWRVDRQRIAWSYDADETDPDWFVTPGAGELGTANDDRVDRVFLRFFDSTDSGNLKTASWPASTTAGGTERGGTITNRGPIDPAVAERIARGVVRKMQRYSGWANGINVTRSQITTKGGQAANLALIRAGDAMRLLGVADPRGLAHHIDVVIGETEYDWFEKTIQLNPVGLADRTFEAILEAASPGATAL